MQEKDKEGHHRLNSKRIAEADAEVTSLARRLTVWIFQGTQTQVSFLIINRGSADLFPP
jgi:hypothetical protein